MEQPDFLTFREFCSLSEVISSMCSFPIAATTVPCLLPFFKEASLMILHLQLDDNLKLLAVIRKKSLHN